MFVLVCPISTCKISLTFFFYWHVELGIFQCVHVTLSYRDIYNFNVKIWRILHKLSFDIIYNILLCLIQVLSFVIGRVFGDLYIFSRTIAIKAYIRMTML